MHPHPQRRHLLTIDAAKLFVDELQAILSVVETNALRHGHDGLLETLAKRSGRSQAPGQIVPHHGAEPRQLAVNRIHRPDEVDKYGQHWEAGLRAPLPDTSLDHEKLLICLSWPCRQIALLFSYFNSI